MVSINIGGVAYGVAIEYTFDWLPQAQTLNTRMHWSQRASLNKVAKEAAIAVIRSQRAEAGRPPCSFADVDMHIHFTVPTKRRHDWLSMYARTKMFEDALVETGELVDDSIQIVRRLTMTSEYVKGESRVSIRITPVAKEEANHGHQG